MVFHYVDTNVNRIDLVDWTSKVDCNKVSNTWQEGNNLLFKISYKGLFTILVSFVRGGYACWLSKTMIGLRERREEDCYETIYRTFS
jgi:hypothetical protein